MKEDIESNIYIPISKIRYVLDNSVNFMVILNFFIIINKMGICLSTSNEEKVEGEPLKPLPKNDSFQNLGEDETGQA